MKRILKRKYQIAFGIFLFLMFVMTIVSRVIDSKKILVVDTILPTTGRFIVSAAGSGTVYYGVPTDEYGGILSESETYYVKGYVENLSYLDNIQIGNEVKVNIERTGQTTGRLAAVTYDYQNNKKEIIVFLDNESNHTGAKADFILENNNFTSSDIIPLNVLYEDVLGYFVYIMETKQDILGNCTIAVKRYVEISAFGNEQAAILDAGNEYNKNVKMIQTNERIYDGMRVREREF